MSKRHKTNHHLAANRLRAVTSSKKRQQIQQHIEKAQAAITRWWRKLRKAVRIIDKNQKQITRLEEWLQTPPGP